MADRLIETEILVVGAGPAGISAAVAASRAASGASSRVTVIDDNPAAGGQIWRGETPASAHSSPSRSWLRRFPAEKITFLPGTRIVAALAPDELLAETPDGTVTLRHRRLILATGARERFLPFPGWTLPNVLGAGGLQALAKAGFPVDGRRVVVAGSGPLLLAVADYLRSRGARVLLIAEQAPTSRLLRFGLSILASPSKLSQSLQLAGRLAGTRYLPGCWPVAAHGDQRLQSVTLRHGSKLIEVECDYLACGFHLLPNTELAELLGCRVTDGRVEVDEWQQTSVPGIFCAGEATGIGGLDLSLAEGQIAGSAPAGDEHAARRLFAERGRARRFAAVLDRTFALRPELKSLPTDETIVCRCEDVTLARLRTRPGAWPTTWHDWRDAKLQTRCGMGPCQGRICGPAVEFILGWPPQSIRPPVLPARVATLAADPDRDPQPHS